MEKDKVTTSAGQEQKSPLLSHDEKRRKRLRGSVNFTAIMTFVSVLALVLLYLALSGISKGQEDLRLEWFIIGLSYVIFSVYIISVIITLSLVVSMPGFFRKKKKEKTDSNQEN
ncbi:MAG TPA: hypothetical protein PLQ61_08560 [Bacteroidales bacterium]|nr:hypothetical protein [Bacteroidales bacterium]HQJ21226.1 hypothetical protein [Bacteroidales bacterium]HRC88499.1 hypothetical protein [Bacteroidales bacterium]